MGRTDSQRKRAPGLEVDVPASFAGFAHPEFLVETEWLEAHLGHSDLRILDCTVHIVFDPQAMFTIAPGQDDFERGHIPGAQFVDLLTELSDTSHPVPLMAPSAAQFASVMSRLGVENGCRVVLYSAQNAYWATRVWWLFRVFGFDNAALLNGGWQRWRREGRPIETGPARQSPPARFNISELRPLMASKADVLAAIGDPAVCIINALPEDQFLFTSGVHYGRPGHITGSLNLPSEDLLDSETNEFLPVAELRRRFERIGAFERPVITYCGGAIAASADAMALVMLGHPDVKLYDGSLLEWAADPSLPMEVDPIPTSSTQALAGIDNRWLLSELREALDRQTATTEVLQIINRSPGNLAPVFEAILDRGLRLCEADFGVFWAFDGRQFRAASCRGMASELAELLSRGPYEARLGSPHARALADEPLVHIPDISGEGLYQSGIDPLHRALVDLGGARTVLAIPLRLDVRLLGILTLYRQQVKLFADKHIVLLQSFAEQALVAMENTRLLTETREALEQQTATAEVLQVINSSPADLAPVFDTVLEKAAQLCDAAFGILRTWDGERFHQVAFRGAPLALEAYWREPQLPTPGTVAYRLAQGEDCVVIPDVLEDPLYRDGARGLRAVVELAGGRSWACVALRKDGRLFGALTIYRTEVHPFTDKQIALLQNFAAQAVIAMDNARLLTETREALEQQTATAEVLQVINSSPGDLAPVFGAILDKAYALCGAAGGDFLTFDGEFFRSVATRGMTDRFTRTITKQPYRLHPDNPANVLVRGEQPFVHVADLAELTALLAADPMARAAFEEGGVRTVLMVPLRKDNNLLGIIVAQRPEVRPFTEKQIALLQNFAAQAVIAMENARLLTETREALEQQTATAEVLQVINSSPGELQPVFEAILEKAHSLCAVAQGSLELYDGEWFRAVAVRGLSDEVAEILRQGCLAADNPATRPLIEGSRFAHILDLAGTDYTVTRSAAELDAARTLLCVPLRRDEALLGMIACARKEVRPFSEKEIALLESFAAQAVIAMDNARLLKEIRQRQAELRVTFDNMGDGVAMFDAELRLAAWNLNFQRILELPDLLLAERPRVADFVRYLATHGEYGAVEVQGEVRRLMELVGTQWSAERVRPDGRVIEVRSNPVPGGGVVLIYSDITERKRAEAEIRTARDTAERALQELQTAQASLLHAQKMAALGQLTAGIAHEIKNPLNFVNNFAELSGELLLELKETTAPAVAALGDDERAAVDEVAEMLRGNLDKIAEHGKRADGIVKSMLEHSRGVSGDRQVVDLNALIEKALNLAYHGARAQDQNFNSTLECELAHIAPIELVPQDMTRVFLNLFGNGFYAAAKRGREAGEANFRPVLKVTTRDLGEAVEIRVRDNGTGIAHEFRDKLFQPFFTTKPTGEGTGLGLSISYDIITQQHGGTIEVDSRLGEFTEFTIRLPRMYRITAEAAS